MSYFITYLSNMFEKLNNKNCTVMMLLIACIWMAHDKDVGIAVCLFSRFQS